MAEPVIIRDATLYCGRAEDVLPALGCIDAVVTSPPYDDLRTYGGHAPADCFGIIKDCAVALAPGGVIMWNIKDQTIDGSETGTSFRHALWAKECGLRIHDTMIYVRRGVTFPDANRYLPAFEYMFIFSNGAPKHFNGIKDRPNRCAGGVIHGTGREPNGTLTKKVRSGQEVPVYGLRYNWWEMHNAEAGTGEFGGHPAPMPYPMAHGHVQTNQVSNRPPIGSAEANASGMGGDRQSIFAVPRPARAAGGPGRHRQGRIELSLTIEPPFPLAEWCGGGILFPWHGRSTGRPDGGLGSRLPPRGLGADPPANTPRMKMSDAPITLIPIRQLHGNEPVIVVPYESAAWRGINRLKSCEIYALPDGAPHEVYDPFWWLQLLGRDVTFCPIDAWSGHVFTLIYVSLRGHKKPFRAMRWAWPKPGNLGDMQQIETLWNGISHV